MKHVLDMDRIFAYLRVAATLTVFGWNIFSPEVEQNSGLFTLTLFFIGYSALLYFIILTKPAIKDLLYRLVSFPDLLVVTMLTWYSGGLNSVFFHGYILLGALHSFYFGWRFGFMLSGFSYLLFLSTNWQDFKTIYWMAPIFEGAILFVISLTIGYLSGQVKERGEAVARQVENLSSLLDVSKTLNSSLETIQVLPMVVTWTAQIMKVKACAVHILDDKEEQLHPVAVLGFPQLEAIVFPTNSSFIGDVVNQGQWQTFDCSNSNSSDHKFQELLKQADLDCCLAVPLTRLNKNLGSLSVYTQGKCRFSDEDNQMLSLMASQVANSIENANLYQKMQSLYLSMVKAFVAAIDIKDSYTRGHSEYVHRYSQAIAKEMGLSEKEIEKISTAAILHDVGKIGVPSNILRKPGQLTSEEYCAIKMHVTIGAQIVSQVPDLKDMAEIINAHHEWFNGKGYPEGLAGKDIPLGARIIGVADAFEAMTANRVYRKSRSKDDAVAELKRCIGTQFDPKVVDAFLKVLEYEEFSQLPVQTQFHDFDTNEAC